jgi:hypothetical protein
VVNSPTASHWQVGGLWRIFGFPIHERHPPVQALAVQLGLLFFLVFKCISNSDATSNSSANSDSDGTKQEKKQDKEPGTGGKTAPAILPNDAKDTNNSSFMSTGLLLMDPNA